MLSNRRTSTSLVSSARGVYLKWECTNSVSNQGQDYSWIGSMFYFGYLFWEYPTNRLLQRLPLAKYSAFNVIMWGLTLCCMAAVENFAGAMTGALLSHCLQTWYT